MIVASRQMLCIFMINDIDQLTTYFMQFVRILYYSICWIEWVNLTNFVMVVELN